MEIAASSAVQHLVNYGAIGLCLILAMIAIVYLDRSREELRKELSASEAARVDDAKATMALVLEINKAENVKITQLTTIAEMLKERSRGGE